MAAHDGPAPLIGRGVAGIQGVYYLLTGVWPLLHIDSFLAVTGPKEDLWLVQTVGVLVAVIGVALVVAALVEELHLTPRILGLGAAAGFIGVDVVFYLKGAIGAVYLLDALAQTVLLVAWIVFWLMDPRTTPRAAT